ncbi:MAG: sugar ABC transporter permease [Anaerolineales bacterium]|nr:sugar ABC transporter permease [Anaerolineales bacterium]
MKITKKRQSRYRLRYDKTTGLLLISPWLIGFVLFKLLPILASLALSFTDFHMLKPAETSFIGLANYGRLLHDEAIGYLIAFTLSSAIRTIPLQLAASIFLAALLSNPRLKAKTTARTLFFLPSIIPGVAIAFMWFGFMDPATGWLNRFILPVLGLDGFNDVYSDAAVAFLYGINSLWAIGPGMLIMLAAMQSISPEIQEAARVDGAGPLVRFFRITLPIITPAIFFTLIINLIAVFGGVILLDRGNTFSGGGAPFDQYITHVMFNEWDLGYASGLAWFFFVIVLVVIIALFTSSRRWVYFPDKES